MKIGVFTALVLLATNTLASAHEPDRKYCSVLSQNLRPDNVITRETAITQPYNVVSDRARKLNGLYWKYGAANNVDTHSEHDLFGH